MQTTIRTSTESRCAVLVRILPLMEDMRAGLAISPVYPEWGAMR
jgi:hypothetical protein